MNGYLVTVSTSLDDIPVGLYGNLIDAEGHALRLREYYATGPIAHHADVARVLDLMGRDDSRYACVSVIGFWGSKPVKIDTQD